MASQVEIQNKIKDVIEKISQKQITEETRLTDEGIIDSIALLEVILGLEEAFGLSIDPFDMDPDNFSSLPEITKFISAKL